MSLCAINFGQSSPASPRENATRRERAGGEQCVPERRRSIARLKTQLGQNVDTTNGALRNYVHKVPTCLQSLRDVHTTLHVDYELYKIYEKNEIQTDKTIDLHYK